jgi:hypothetical protein
VHYPLCYGEVLASHRVADAGGRRFAPAESLPPGYSIPAPKPPWSARSRPASVAASWQRRHRIDSIGLPGAGISYRQRQSAPRGFGLGWTIKLSECRVVQ